MGTCIFNTHRCCLPNRQLRGLDRLLLTRNGQKYLLPHGPAHGVLCSLLTPANPAGKNSTSVFSETAFISSWVRWWTFSFFTVLKMAHILWLFFIGLFFFPTISRSSSHVGEVSPMLWRELEGFSFLGQTFENHQQCGANGPEKAVGRGLAMGQKAQGPAGTGHSLARGT